MNAIVSEKGQVTIPKRLRDSLGLEPGVVLEFIEQAGTLVARKLTREDPFLKWRGRGRLPKAKSVDAFLEKIRDGK